MPRACSTDPESPENQPSRHRRLRQRPMHFHGWTEHLPTMARSFRLAAAIRSDRSCLGFASEAMMEEFTILREGESTPRIQLKSFQFRSGVEPKSSGVSTMAARSPSRQHHPPHIPTPVPDVTNVRRRLAATICDCLDFRVSTLSVDRNRFKRLLAPCLQGFRGRRALPGQQECSAQAFVHTGKDGKRPSSFSRLNARWVAAIPSLTDKAG